MDRETWGEWGATVHGVPKSQTWLKWLSIIVREFVTNIFVSSNRQLIISAACLLYGETQILFQQTISNNFHESLVLTKLKIYPAKYTFPQILNTRYFQRKSNPNVYNSFTLKSSKHYLTIPFGCLILCFPNCIIVYIFKKKLLSALNYLDNCVNHILCILHVDKS